MGALGGYPEAIVHTTRIAPDIKFVEDKELTGRCEAAVHQGLVATAEAYCVDVLMSERNDKVTSTLQARIASMAKRQVDPDNLLPSMWAKVQHTCGLSQ